MTGEGGGDEACGAADEDAGANGSSSAVEGVKSAVDVHIVDSVAACDRRALEGGGCMPAQRDLAS